MRHVVASVLVSGCFASDAAAFQARAGAAGGTPSIRACSLLPKELVEKYFPNKAVFPYLKPSEEATGNRGSSCHYGTIGLQVDPFARPEEIKKTLAKDGLESVAGVGDFAYFRINRNTFAELIVWTGSHHFTIQMSINQGSTAAATKLDAIAVAKAIIPKLR